MGHVNDEELEKAHEACNHNREAISKSVTCGCFYCLSIFPATEVDHYWGDSAVCPHCELDSVIGDASGYPITPEFLKEMNECWFGAPRPENANMPGFDNARAAEIFKAIETVAKSVDPGCDVSAKIISALHAHTFGVVSSRLFIELNFSCFR